MGILYTDYDLQIPTEETILFEGVSYYVDTECYSSTLIQRWLEEESLENCILNYHPKNKILIMRFDNIVGFVNILGKQYDIRSKKLYDTLNGNDQFQTLLDDVSNLYSKLSFNFKGTAYAKREVQNEYTLDDLDIFDYYYQLAFMFPKNVSLGALISECLRMPNTVNIQSTTQVSFQNSKKLSDSFYKHIGRMNNLIKISDNHPLASTSYPNQTFQRLSKRLLPLVVSNTSFIPTINTTENRFLKYFLEEINAICIKILNKSKDVVITSKAKKLQKMVDSYLLNTFFKSIQRLTYIPNSSSVLLKKAGYREIYYHFVQSRFAFKPILENQKKYALKYGLKNIANLYELWVFLKMAYLIFGNKKITEIFEGQVKKNDVMIGSYKWKSDNIELHYNKSYTRSNSSSYSVTLRPDISLTMNDNELYLFDAKYKFNSNNQDDDLLVRIVKPEDIHKMHAYLDAIPLARTAIVLYPGTEIVIYEKNILKEDNDKLNGVGAIPIIPNQDQSLLYILQQLKCV